MARRLTWRPALGLFSFLASKTAFRAVVGVDEPDAGEDPCSLPVGGAEPMPAKRLSAAKDELRVEGASDGAS